GNSPKPYFIKPCLYNTANIEEAVAERQFDLLPDLLIDAAQNAHRVFINTQDGQYADVIIDTAALKAIRDAGRRSQSAMIDTVTELTCAAANIKTVVRAVKTNKDLHFLDNAVCECDTLDKTTLIAAALKGEDALRDYLYSTPYDEAVQSGSLSALEKWFDDRLMEIIKSAKSLFFGPEPLAAYYLAREAEIRNIRILLSGKRHGADDATIRERMRNLYV
ncbi:MAG: V-type ATPase subunit, partial [Oscillospiraceae bacterium]|nr:V-type ATPase subunit [Oscillospiraceae bacterium]